MRRLTQPPELMDERDSSPQEEPPDMRRDRPPLPPGAGSDLAAAPPSGDLAAAQFAAHSTDVAPSCFGTRPTVFHSCAAA